MTYVLDCSVVATWIFDDERTAATEDLLDGLATKSAWVPALWHFEFGNLLVLGVRRKRLSEAAAAHWWERITALPLRVDDLALPELGDTVLPLALAEGLTFYDASYLELAERRAVALATLDSALAAACRRRAVTLVL